jgi:hypothetical protein
VPMAVNNRQKINKEMIEKAYEVIKPIYDNGMCNNEIEYGIKELENYKWKKNCAKYTFANFNKLMNGEAYHWRMSVLQTKIFLENIYRDYKKMGLEKALISVRMHLANNNNKLIGIKKVYEEYIKTLK